ncbi:NADH/Ubiquinone/plastoquinone (Complex I) [Candidatus Accumulibacter aalborgensis]|uniref:NADH/Ubiquinone/plastoquinone (Complex I) n=1 Tax=Candidatus Accumulibacter aalborgensis TaxID=1860102 RepID=A0A1A8XXB8_9PROT|nr:monovalent cation/H+ antiporter subunit D [Candidatus Accumulibacter aalborgensis]SBT08673.1 NADH/Ubiquinone/plastoquinone (Complex I) [Candidatus Accumulibacter aalborgensis]
MNAHAPILPILIPFAAALLQMATDRLAFQRIVGLLTTALLVVVTAWLVLLADDGVLRVYALGDWPAPFGIVLVVDRLAAGMTLLTAVLGFLALLYASAGFDARGRHFHPLFQFQLVGLSGAFLTGDLFNLFVFFEVMLLASYALLAHGGGLARTRAGISYVVLNLVGSALFLIALGLLYGTLGTLNLADLASRLPLAGHDQALARLAFALLIAVFVLKAGLLPLSFWLPPTYTAAGAPVAALFAIMTKVGIVAILRVQAIALTPAIPDLLDRWLTTLALATVVFAALGVLAAARLRALAAWLVLLSAATLLITPAQASAPVDAAALYYLVQSTLAGAAFFLLAGVIADQRGGASDYFKAGPQPAIWVKIAFLILATTVAGLPPFSGFVGKLMLLTTLRAVSSGTAIWVAIWVVLLASSFIVMIALARDGCLLIWEHEALAGQPPAEGIAWQRATATLLLVAAGPLLALFARPLADYAERAANQLHTPGAYVAGVLAPTAAKNGGEEAR